MSELQPTDFQTRSPHYRILLAEGAQFKQYGHASIVANYGQNTEQERSKLKHLSLIDLTPLPRTGFKGKASIQWAQEQGLDIGEINNFAYKQPNGMLIARLADTEVLILNNIGSEQNQCSSLDDSYLTSNPTRCYSVPRYDASAWLYITGEQASTMFAKICGVDLRVNKFQNGNIAQTSIARINGIIIRDDIYEIPAFHLVFDSASADYMWKGLKDAFKEFDGACIGYDSLS